jgi:RNA polymerase sigma factor for flagellar operon FliA
MNFVALDLQTIISFLTSEKTMMTDTVNVTAGSEEIKSEQKSEIKSMWSRYGKTHDVNLRNELVEHFLPRVDRCAADVFAHTRHAVDYNDLYQAGVMGLIDAVESFNPDRKVKFETYSYYRVRGAILDAIREGDWVPRLVRMRVRQVENIRQPLQSKLGYRPNHEELSAALGTECKSETILSDANLVTCSSIDVKYAGEPHINLLDELPDPRAANSYGVGADADETAISDLIGKEFTRSEYLIIMLYYKEGMTMREIGKTLDLSESRVSQVHKMVLQRLRVQLEQNGEEDGIAAIRKSVFTTPRPYGRRSTDTKTNAIGVTYQGISSKDSADVKGIISTYSDAA